MSDRELLELAAKAAGAEHNGYRYGENGREPLYGMPFELDDGIEYQPWNPLADDGDALRLAVKLHIQIGILSEPEVWAQFYRADDKVTGWITIKEPTGSDPYAATRRAVVRAAAEIGGING